MPIFEYECPGCGQLFEKLVKSASQADHVICPNCGGKHVRRKMSTFALKGSLAPSRSTPAPVVGST